MAVSRQIFQVNSPKWIFVALLFFLIVVLSTCEARRVHVINVARFGKYLSQGRPGNECGKWLMRRCRKITNKCHTTTLTKRSIADQFQEFLIKHRSRLHSRRQKKKKYIRVSCGRCSRSCW